MPDMQPGLYHAKLKSGMTATSRQGTPQVVLTVDVTHKAHNDDWVAMPEPIERRLFLAMSDRAWPYTEAKLEKIGFNGHFDDNMGFTKTDLQLHCNHEEWEGVVREKWEFADFSGFTPEPADADTIRKLNAIWKNKHGAAVPVSAQGPSTPPAAGPTQEPDDGRILEPERVDNRGIPF